MRAFLVEFAGADDAAARGLVDAPVRDGAADRRLLDPPVFGVAVPIHPDPPRDEPRDGEPA